MEVGINSDTPVSRDLTFSIRGFLEYVVNSSSFAFICGSSLSLILVTAMLRCGLSSVLLLGLVEFAFDRLFEPVEVAVGLRF